MAGRLAAWLSVLFWLPGWLGWQAAWLVGIPPDQVSRRIRDCLSVPACASGCGWGRPNWAKATARRWAHVEDAPVEDASWRDAPVEIAPVGLPRSSLDFWQKLSGGRENQWPRNRNRLERVSGVWGRGEEKTRRMGCRGAASQAAQPGRRQRTQHTRKPSLTLQTSSDKNRYSNRNFRTLRFD